MHWYQYTSANIGTELIMMLSNGSIAETINSGQAWLGKTR